MKINAISYVANFIFAIVFLALCAYKREAIKARFLRLFEKKISEEQLLKYNAQPIAAVEKFCVAGDKNLANNTRGGVSILFFGNSLTLHAPYAEDDGKPPRGMAASDVEKDYVHLLVQKIAKEKGVNVKYTMTNGAHLERNFSKEKFDFSRFGALEEKKFDFVVVQLGENVLENEIKSHSKEFENQLAEFLGKFEDSVKIISLPFWPNDAKNYALTKVAIRTGAFLVDLGHLGSGSDKSNFAYSKRKYKDKGVGLHPGDAGMERIADCFYTVFNAVME